MEVTMDKKLILNNLISLRRKYNKHDFFNDIFKKKKEISSFIDDTEQFMITIIHNFNNQIENPEYDIEVMFKPSGGSLPQGFSFQNINLEKTVSAEIINEPEKMKDIVRAINDCAVNNNLSIGKNVWVQYNVGDNSHISLYCEVI